MNRLINKLILLIAASILLPLNGVGVAAFAQTAGTNSSYSRFGLGLLHDQSHGFSKSMGGAAIGVRIGNVVNTANPASYSAIDSLSLIFDVGMNAYFGKMKQGAKGVGINGAGLDYVHVGMHLAKRLGLAVGFMPYTDIGYEYFTSKETIGSNAQSSMTNTHQESYIGSGGLTQAYLGLGWRAYRNLSVGANISVLWGDYNHSVIPAYAEGGVYTDAYTYTAKLYQASLLTYKLDFGAQYPVRLSKQDWLSIGATFGLGHNLPQDAEVSTGTKIDTISSPFSLPYTFGIGAAWQHKNTLHVAADVRHELWSKCSLPEVMAMESGYKNMTMIAVGAQWTPNPLEKKYWKRIQYRVGVSFTTPYLKVNGMNGPSELSLRGGVGLPITNRTNNRSVINFGLQWMRRSASGTGMLKEDYLLLNLGITFNERWFMKYKIE